MNPLDPNGVNGSAASNTVISVVFCNNYSQQISDLIHSIALEEAAIGNIANAEGATPNELLCVNKSAFMVFAIGLGFGIAVTSTGERNGFTRCDGIDQVYGGQPILPPNVGCNITRMCAPLPQNTVYRCST